MRLALLLLLLACACGGGSAGPVQVPFGLSATWPAAGAYDAPPEGPFSVTFSGPPDPATVTESTIWLERENGTRVNISLTKPGATASTVLVQLALPLAENERYRLRVAGQVTSAKGVPLGQDHLICFVTASTYPTVRPDQIKDLGDGLAVPRCEARGLRLPGGSFIVFGGFVDPDTATDTVEVWDPASRTFTLLEGRMIVPRAEHAVTMLGNGSILITGGVSAGGGPPLASTEYFNPATGQSTLGPDLVVPRRWHGASLFRGGAGALVTGGYGEDGEMLDSAEALEADSWTLLGATLPRPTATHIQVLFGYDEVYVGSSNLSAIGAWFNAGEFAAIAEEDTRFRASAVRRRDGKLFIVGGDTRSISTYDPATHETYMATTLLRERRGSHSLTERDGTSSLFLVAGGFNIAKVEAPPLDSMEIVKVLDPGPNGKPGAEVYLVDNVVLPVPFAGHVGFVQPDGATVLAGGFGDGIGPHLRRVVIVHSNASSPQVSCGDG